jgi:hypothetical protein
MKKPTSETSPYRLNEKDSIMAEYHYHIAGARAAVYKLMGVQAGFGVPKEIPPFPIVAPPAPRKK